MSLIPEQKEIYWSRFAADFNERNKYVVGQKTIDIIQDKLKQQKNPGRLLELGCGNGEYTEAVSMGAENVIATDFSDEMIETAKNILKANTKIKVEKADCLNAHYGDKSFESVFMANLIHVISDPEKLLQESRRILKPDGRLMVMSFTGDGMSFFNMLGMIIRYLKTYGKPPKSGTNFGLKKLTAFIEKNSFQIEEAVLLGEKTKAVFIRARKAA